MWYQRLGHLDHLGAAHADRLRQERQPVADHLAVGHPRGVPTSSRTWSAMIRRRALSRISGTPPDSR